MVSGMRKAKTIAPRSRRKWAKSLRSRIRIGLMVGRRARGYSRRFLPVRWRNTVSGDGRAQAKSRDGSAQPAAAQVKGALSGKPAGGRKRCRPSSVANWPKPAQVGAEARRRRRRGEADLLLEGQPFQQFSCVPRARIWPWSMMPIREQSREASSR